MSGFDFTLKSRALFPEEIPLVAKVNHAVKAQIRKDTAMKTTQWFDGREFVPGTPGVYQRLTGSAIWFSRWDGARWGLLMYLANDAARSTKPSRFQKLYFRGLATNPKEK